MMNKRLLTSAVLVAVALTSSLSATDFRAPLISKAPLRYTLEEKKKDSKFTVQSTGYFREANKAYMKHGFKTKPLSSVIFGSDYFKMSDALSSDVTGEATAENYNAAFNATYIAPRITYSERGVVLGAQWEHPVWANKGRVGIRASIPFRTIRIERDNEAEDVATGGNEYVVYSDPAVVKDFPVTGLKSTGGNINVDTKVMFSNLYKYNLLKSMPYPSGDTYVPFISQASNITSVSTVAYDKDFSETNAYSDKNKYKDIPFAVIRSSGAPYGAGKAIQLADSIYGSSTNVIKQNTAAPSATIAPDKEIQGSVVYAGDADILLTYNDSSTDISAGSTKYTPLTELPDVPANVEEGKMYAFAKGLDYETKLDSISDELWLVTIQRAKDGAKIAPSVDTQVQNLLRRYYVDVNDWLRNHGGFAFATDQLTGAGDADLDLFYEHTFCNNWRGEISAGLRLPTGFGSREYGANPYKARLGNGEHFEARIGGVVGWQMLKWLSMKLDASYSYVFNATEQRAAAFKNATVKNIGPRADADVDWAYFTGNCDFTLYHPKTNDLSTTIGYQLYYKTEDRVSFKEKTINLDNWFGKKYNATDKDFTTAFEADLDNNVARKDTEQVAHRAHVEGFYKISKFFDVFVGGAYTFAGQHAPQESDMHGGFNVRF